MARRRRPQHGQPHDPQRGQPMATNPQLAGAMLEIVDNQLRDGTPPETKQTFDRLIGLGYSPEGARQLLAHVVVAEIFAVMARGEVYNQARYIAALRRLPALPDQGEDA